jgi:hypothetical protein
VSPTFKAGVEEALEKAKVFFMRNAPVFAGIGTGALIGKVMSPKKEPDKYKTTGAVIGGLAGYTRLNKWRSKLGPRWQVAP